MRPPATGNGGTDISTEPRRDGLPHELRVTLAEFLDERVPGADEDVHFTESVATAVIEALSAPGDLVLDPFAGYGTTLAVATRLGRRALGVELLPERVELSRRRAPDATVVEGDARGLHHLLGDVEPGSVALCLTSPPYMTRNDHPQDPLTAYEVLAGDYGSYLQDLRHLAGTVAGLLAPTGHLVLNVATIRHEGVVTDLAEDIVAALAPVVPLVGRSTVRWDHLPHDLTADHLLVFGTGGAGAASR